MYGSIPPSMVPAARRRRAKLDAQACGNCSRLDVGGDTRNAGSAARSDRAELCQGRLRRIELCDAGLGRAGHLRGGIRVGRPGNWVGLFASRHHVGVAEIALSL